MYLSLAQEMMIKFKPPLLIPHFFCSWIISCYSNHNNVFIGCYSNSYDTKACYDDGFAVRKPVSKSNGFHSASQNKFPGTKKFHEYAAMVTCTYMHYSNNY